MKLFPVNRLTLSYCRAQVALREVALRLPLTPSLSFFLSSFLQRPSRPVPVWAERGELRPTTLARDSVQLPTLSYQSPNRVSEGRKMFWLDITGEGI